jgi:hypothetical protein
MRLIHHHAMRSSAHILNPCGPTLAVTIPSGQFTQEIHTIVAHPINRDMVVGCVGHGDRLRTNHTVFFSPNGTL